MHYNMLIKISTCTSPTVANFSIRYVQPAVRPGITYSQRAWPASDCECDVRQFVAGNLTSVERSLPHPQSGEERTLRVWGMSDRCDPISVHEWNESM